MISLSFTVRRLSNGACGLLIFPTDRSTEAARELAAPVETYPAAIWAVSLLLPGGVRLSLPAAALPGAADRVAQEGAAALLHLEERSRRLPVAIRAPDDGLRKLIEHLGGEPVSESCTALLRWDAPPERVPELLHDRGAGTVLAIDPRGLLESTALPRPRPLNWAEESQLRLRFAMRETGDGGKTTSFFLPPGRVALVDGERLPPGEYTLRAGGLSRMIPAAAQAAAAGAEVCLDADWPALSEAWDLYVLWLGTGVSQPPETESSPIWGAVRGLLPENWEHRLPPMRLLTEGDAEYLSRHLLALRLPAKVPDRPLGKHGARELIRCLCGLNTGALRRPAEVTALLRLGAARRYFSETPQVLLWDRRQIEELVAKLEKAL